MLRCIKIRVLLYKEAYRLFRLAGLPFCRQELTENSPQAVVFSKKISYPVAMKLIAAEVVDKSKIGAVVTNIFSADEVRHYFNEIKSKVHLKVPGANIEGILVQQMRSGIELVVRAKRDPIFGPVITLKVGGIYDKILSKVSLRVAPFGVADSKKMIAELEAEPIFNDPKQPLFREGLIEFLQNLSKLMIDNEKIDEVSIHPLVVEADKLSVIDFRVISSEDNLNDF